MESIRKETKEKDSSKIEEVKKLKLALCRICRDTGAMHPPYPDAIRRYFRRFQVFFVTYFLKNKFLFFFQKGL